MPSDTTLFRTFHEITPDQNGHGRRRSPGCAQRSGARQSATTGTAPVLSWTSTPRSSRSTPRTRRGRPELLLLTELRVPETGGIASDESLSWLRSDP